MKTQDRRCYMCNHCDTIEHKCLWLDRYILDLVTDEAWARLCAFYTDDNPILDIP